MSSGCCRSSASASRSRPRLKFAAGGPNGRVSVLVASGEAEIGLQQVSELMSNPDVEVIGLLPDKLQQITINSAGITAVAKEPDAARALIRHLTTPEALAIYKAKGLGDSTTASRRAAAHLNAPFFSSACHFAMSLLRYAASFSGEPPM